MRIGFRYEDPPAGESGQPNCQVFDADTGEPIEMVTAISFSMNAGDMVPRLHIECIPSQIHLNDDGNVETRTVEHAPSGVATFPTRERVVDLDGGPDEDQG